MKHSLFLYYYLLVIVGTNCKPTFAPPCTVTEDDSTLGGGHTMKDADDVSQKCTPETHIILSINVTPNKFNKKKTWQSKLYKTKNNWDTFNNISLTLHA